MVKCEYCGKEISVLAVRYIWLERGKKAIHDKCLKKQYEQRKIKVDELIIDDLKALDDEVKISKDYQKRIGPIYKSIKVKLKNIKDKNNWKIKLFFYFSFF